MSLWLQVEQSLFLVYFNLLSKVKSKIIAKQRTEYVNNNNFKLLMYKG